jgi:flagellar motility protein MotE (MotC chaperone)
MTKLLTSPLMTTLLGVVVYLGATAAFWKTPPIPTIVPSVAAAGDTRNGPSWNFTNPEADQLIGELKAEKKSLDDREQSLNDLAARLQTERNELNSVTQSVYQLQMDFDKNVMRIGEDESVNLKKLAKVYADMDPASAASILKEMDDATIIKIMVFMKDTETAAIWEAMAKTSPAEAARTARLSDRLRLTSFRNNAAK